MLADMLAAGLNPNLGGGEHSAAYVEKQVIDWCKQIFDFPGEASGLLVSGGSMANLVGITAARNRRAGYNVREIGLGSSSEQMVMYASSETHSSNVKAVELLGLGRRWLRTIPVDSEYRMKLSSLEEAINKDRNAGLQPVCVIANAGTTNTGAFDDLEVIAEICKRENIWMHVDGAFGAFAKLIPGYQHLTKGIERADSLAFDLHKWMYLPFEVGCVLVRSEEDHRYAFSLTPDYLEHMPRGLAAGKTWFSDYGLQLTRGFRALKVWMSLKENGIRKYARLIEKDIGLAQYLRVAIDASSHLENLAPVPLNIVCFRYNKPGLDQDELNELNKEILFELHERGIAVPSYTTLDEKFALRVSITNHRSRREDIDLFIDAVVRIGDALSAS
jgi:glutamate/tyrosine decarboxylase-like PLP-dependent enzyme